MVVLYVPFGCIAHPFCREHQCARLEIMDLLQGITFVPTSSTAAPSVDKWPKEEKKQKKKKKKKKKNKKSNNRHDSGSDTSNISGGEDPVANGHSMYVKHDSNVKNVQQSSATLSFEELLARAKGSAGVAPKTTGERPLLAKKTIKQCETSKYDPNKAAAEALKRQLLGLPVENKGNPPQVPIRGPLHGSDVLGKRRAELKEERRLHYVNKSIAGRSNNKAPGGNAKANSIMSSRFHKEGENIEKESGAGSAISSSGNDLDSIFIRNVLKRGKRFKGITMETGGTGEDAEKLDMSLFTDNRTVAQKQNAVRSNAGRDQRRVEEQAHRDPFNISNAHFPKHLIISMNENAYLMLPRTKPITKGHCLIVPLQAIKSMTHADDGLNESISEYKNSLLRMFQKEDRSCVFLETVMNIHRSHHTAIHCIPIPNELAEESPIYFQQALLQSDTEWTSHKKVINTSKSRYIKHSIPAKFSYFHVEICTLNKTKTGYAHIIEDAKKFSPYFGEDVINDLLGNPPSRFGRKEKKKLNFAQQRDIVIGFKEMYKDFDIAS